MRLTPTHTGALQLLAICQVRYAPSPAAFLVTGLVRDLQVSWALQDQQGGALLQPWRQQQEQQEGQEQEQQQLQLERLASHASASSSAGHAAPAAPRAASRCRSAASRPASAAAAAAAAEEEYLEANFGCEVPIGHSRRLRLVIRNDTSIRADVRAWFATFGTDASQGLAAGVQGARRLSASRRGAAAASKTGGCSTSAAGSPEPRHGTAGEGGNAGGGGTLPAITLSDAHEHSRPFRAEQGCAMIARQAAAQQARRLLGGKGLALAVSPPEAVLEPRGCLVLELACHNDMCGNYVDELLVQVGGPGGCLVVRDCLLLVDLVLVRGPGTADCSNTPWHAPAVTAGGQPARQAHTCASGRGGHASAGAARARAAPWPAPRRPGRHRAALWCPARGCASAAHLLGAQHQLPGRAAVLGPAGGRQQ